ncbi:unnamed protein product [Clonostachys rosea]|uniref:C-CAP/cofactor C-like domain-containing protein n=1 Tax=Bionectria ochroleuca TaxID=29856 RepID=A0ABY6UZN6_BIOOC|nr:unnamed protein product [Clonostachys rosea]
MATQAEVSTHPLAGPKVLYRSSTMDPKERFYRHFLENDADLRDQISQLESLSNVGGERQEAIDHILAGISKLQNEVADAAEFTPSYDRKQYSEAVKNIQDALNDAVTKITPKSRFQFKRTTKTVYVDMGAPENDPRLNPGSLSRKNTLSEDAEELSAAVVEDTVSELPSSKNYNEELSRPSSSSVRKPSFSAARSIGITNQTGLHIILPSSAARATAAGSLTDLSGCIIDMSIPTSGGTAFPGLALKNIKTSLVVAGRVNGPVHITGVTDSILVVAARQVRIHECKNVDIYLHCGSHPIIEDCSGMRFAPLPACYVSEAEETSENQWDQVDDFKWLKAGHSPNWTTLPEEERLSAEVWTGIIPGKPGASVDEILAKVGIPRT